MERGDRDELEKVLRRIPTATWQEFFTTEGGHRLRRRLHAIDQAVDGLATTSATGKVPMAVRIVQLLGYGVMQNPECGPWIREQLLRRASVSAWARLVAAYAALDSRKKIVVRGNASQRGKGPAGIASYWHQGGTWAKVFCETFGMPDAVWQRRGSEQLNDEEVVPSEPLPPLHAFQRSVYSRLRELLMRRARGRTALLSLPTGAGKTRVVVEAISDHLAESAGKGGAGSVLWIAHSAELQAQAWACFREVWQVPPRRTGQAPVRRVQPLRLVRLWGGRSPDTIGDEAEGPELLVASVDQLASWSHRAPDALDRLKTRRFLCAVVDEAHGVITNEYRTVLEALGFKAEHRWLPASSAALLVGLTATPWRKANDQDAALRRFFSSELITPKELGKRPVASLQERGILARITAERIRIPYVPPMTARQLDHVERFHELPSEYLDQLAELAERNREILRHVKKLGSRCKTLVFACSIEHADMLAACINTTGGTGTAVAVTSATPRAERSLIIEQFRGSCGPRVLCTVGVLAAGFDAPKVGAVVITRPTMSAALYEQMVGRGLRGPMNGGTKSCKVIDVQDEGLPEGILSYERVVGRWSDGGVATFSRRTR